MQQDSWVSPFSNSPFHTAQLPHSNFPPTLVESFCTWVVVQQRPPPPTDRFLTVLWPSLQDHEASIPDILVYIMRLSPALLGPWATLVFPDQEHYLGVFPWRFCGGRSSSHNHILHLNSSDSWITHLPGPQKEPLLYTPIAVVQRKF